MDTKFQTSFIPKKSFEPTAQKTAPVSVFLLISLVVFILTLAAAGGVYTYQRILVSRIDGVNAQLVKAKNSFEPSFIESVNTLYRRIESAKKIIGSHIVISPLFELLEDETLATVRFDGLNYELRETGATVRLSGEGKSFSSVALQSDIFGQNKAFKSPVFSDLNPNQSGNIVFKFSAVLDPKLITYTTPAVSPEP